MLSAVAAACSTTDPAPRVEPPATPLDAGPPVIPADGGPPPDAADGASPKTIVEPLGGTRIAAQYARTSDGARVFHRLFDKQLGVPCELVRLEDGRFRCLPMPVAYVGYQFEDEACTTPVITHQWCTPAVAIVPVAGAPCPSRYEVRAIGAETEASALYQQVPGAACVTSGLLPGTKVYEVGATMPASSFVGYEDETVSLGDGVGIRIPRGEDGSRIAFWHFLDEKRAKGCTIATATDDTVRCMPAGQYVADFFSDSACTKRAGYQLGCNEYGFERDENVIEAPATCSAAKRPFYVGGQPLDGMNPLFAGSTSECVQSLDNSNGARAAGTEISPAPFPLLGSVAGGGSRITEMFAAAGNHLVRRWLIRDAALGVPCRFARAVDGKLRCLPTGANIGGWFTDANCTQPVVYVDGCEPAKYARGYAASGCEPAVRVVAVGAQVPATTPLHAGSPGACTHMPSVAVTAAMHFAGADVDPTVFAEAALVDR